MRRTKLTLALLLLIPFKGFFFALAFPGIVIVTVISGAWTKRKELQMRLERDHSRAVAFLLSFVEGLIYVAAFPLVIIGTLIKKIALERMIE